MSEPRQPGLPTSGEDLYSVLGLEKTCTQEDIRRSYRKLALKYHPDKNPEDPNAANKFNVVQHAYSVLSDANKRKVYDQYGFLGLYAAEQFGEENMNAYLILSSWWAKGLFVICGLVTGCYFCCCLCCCFNCCCGRCKPKTPANDDADIYMWSKDVEEQPLIDQETDGGIPMIYQPNVRRDKTQFSGDECHATFL